MSSPLIPDIENWDIATLNRLIELRDIERETFEFKGVDFKELYKHLCAFANYPTSGIIVLGIEEIKPQKVVIRFRKAGFDSNKENWIQNEINNQMALVDPIPKVTVRILQDTNENGRLYPILGIAGKEDQRPYFVKKADSQCFVRIGASTTPASRTTVLHLFSNIIAKRNNVERLRSSAGFFREALMHTSERIKDIDPIDVDEKLLPLDISYMSSAALSAYRFLDENNLLGGHDKNYSFTGGFYLFMQEIQKLNSFINWFNEGNDGHRKHMKEKKLQYWIPTGSDYKSAVGFLGNIIIKCDEFLSKV
jgi:Putative DNA-binding domain